MDIERRGYTSKFCSYLFTFVKFQLLVSSRYDVRDTDVVTTVQVGHSTGRKSLFVKQCHFFFVLLYWMTPVQLLGGQTCVRL